ncbi:peptide deformylase [Candidatus Kaiserbacteria bacterium]|nr:peptide deformylase [Candidatus Kaiserbacteria bacterium]
MAKLVPQTHPALHAIAEEVPVEDITSPRIQKILKDMRAALHSYKAAEYVGLAIAAPQIGVPLRIFLVEDLQKKKKDAAKADPPHLPSLVAINPRILRLSKKKQLMHEGCLSVKDVYGGVTRSTHATIRAYDERGTPYERGASGLLAQIFQHEVDHLDGILFVDRAEEILHPEEIATHRRAQTAV